MVYIGLEYIIKVFFLYSLHALNERKKTKTREITMSRIFMHWNKFFRRLFNARQFYGISNALKKIPRNCQRIFPKNYHDKRLSHLVRWQAGKSRGKLFSLLSQGVFWHLKHSVPLRLTRKEKCSSVCSLPSSSVFPICCIRFTSSLFVGGHPVKRKKKMWGGEITSPFIRLKDFHRRETFLLQKNKTYNKKEKSWIRMYKF